MPEPYLIDYNSIGSGFINYDYINIILIHQRRVVKFIKCVKHYFTIPHNSKTKKLILKTLHQSQEIYTHFAYRAGLAKDFVY